MPISDEQALDTVRRYLELVASGTAEEVVALYAPDGVLEDPVGSEPRHGREALKEFYATVEALPTTTTLVTARASGGEAAFHFRLETDTGSGMVTVDLIEMMVLDDDGLITSMRAWWGSNDMTFA